MSKRVEHVYVGPKMDLLEKAQWVTALLDGSFKQGRGFLCKLPRGRHGGKREKRYCCLGVKAVLDGHDFSRAAQDPPLVVGPQLFCLDDTDLVGSYDDIPEGKVYSSDSDDPVSLLSFLIDVNDHRHWSFKKIAQWADTNL